MPDGEDRVAYSDSCGLPVSVQMQRLRAALAGAGIDDIPVISAELGDLAEDELQSAIDSVVACDPSPLVVFDGRVVCSGSLEIPLILDSIHAGGL